MTAIFPRWAERLGIEAELVGRDVPVGAERAAYRDAVDGIAADPAVRGALVTTHKVALYEHAADRFAELDDDARLLGEVSCIVKRPDGALVGMATDPVTAGRALEEIVGARYWSDREAHVLCLGGGGAGAAITIYLARGSIAPARIVVADTRGERLEAVRAVHAALGYPVEIDVALVRAPADADRLLGAAPPGSLVVNATGMGKDAAGSPLTGAARFPDRAVVWELNYRGDLAFLCQAREQEGGRRLRIHDGWRYFVHGWAEILSRVFGFGLTPGLLDDLAADAEPFRPA